MQDLMNAWQADVAKTAPMGPVLDGRHGGCAGRLFAAPFSFVRVEARWVLAGFLLGAPAPCWASTARWVIRGCLASPM
jgi:hypothetical protein